MAKNIPKPVKDKVLKWVQFFIILFIATKCLADDFSDEILGSFVYELKRRNPHRRMNV